MDLHCQVMYQHIIVVEMLVAMHTCSKPFGPQVRSHLLWTGSAQGQ